MKLLPTTRAPDRAGAGPATRDQAPAGLSGEAVAFDSVLSKVQGQPVPETAAQVVAKVSPTQASAALESLRQIKVADDMLTGAAPGDAGLTVDGNPTSALDIETDEAAVGALLQRIKSKEDSADPEPTAQNPSSSIDPARAAPFLLPLPAPPPPTDSQPAAKNPVAVIAAQVSRPPPNATEQQAGAAPATGKIVTGVSFATHVAPVDSDRTLALAPDDHAAAAQTPEAPGSAPQSKPETKPERTVSLDTPISAPVAPTSRSETRGPANPTEADDAKAIGTVAPIVAAAGGTETSHHDDTPRDRGGAEPAAPRPVDEAAPTSSPTIAPQAPVKSIVAAVVDLAGQPQPASPSVEPAKAAQPGLARTITLQMSPENLGTVEVRLHMVGQSLDLQLKISERETLDMVTRERDTLTASLHDRHYELHSLVIQDGSTSTPSGGTHVAKQDNSGEQRTDHRGGDSPGGRTGNGRESQDPDRQARGGARPRGEDSPRARAADRGSLFI